MQRIAIAVCTALAVVAVAVAHEGETHDDGQTLARDVRGTPKKPTFHGHVKRILTKHCTSCHHAGDIAPMSLDNHADASLFIDAALEEIRLGQMPPWRPTRGVGDIADERRLSDREISTLVRWQEQGAPEGRPPRKPRTPEYATGWLFGEPDAVLSYGEAFDVPGVGDDIYRCFPLQTNFGEDVWVRAFDVQPGDRRVVHHVVLYLDTEGESHAHDAGEAGPGYTCFGGPGLSAFDPESGALQSGMTSSPILGGWAPGNRPSLLPNALGIRIPAGATVVMQVHYHPLPGEPVEDLSTFGLYLSDHPSPGDVLLLPVVNQDFTIPAGDPAYEVTAELDPTDLVRRATGFDVDVGLQILAVLPHMHLLGKEISVDVDLPDGTSQRLVEITDWSFDWQDSYSFRKPVSAPAGSSLRLRCVFDNSAENTFNPNDPPLPVSWGENTVDEMALAFVATTLRFDDDLLRTLDNLGLDLPHPIGLPPLRAGRAPDVRRVWIDGRGRLRVDAKRLQGGGRIEIDGVPIADSMKETRRGRRLTSVAAWTDHVTPGVPVEVRVRRADGRLSPFLLFTQE